MSNTMFRRIINRQPRALFSRKRPRLSGFLLLLLFALLILSPPLVFAAEPENISRPQQSSPSGPVDSLWEKAEAAHQNKHAAAKLYSRIYEKYPDSPRAEQALWYAAKLYKNLADQTMKVTWEQVKNLFKAFVTDFPDSPHAEEAYLNVGISYFQMKLYREALIYLNLFEDRFPDSALIPVARYWQGKTLIETGRYELAQDAFSGLLKSQDVEHYARGLMGVGDIWYAKKEHNKALEYYKQVIEKDPDYYVEKPLVLLKLGKAYMQAGELVQGRKYLFHYLNLSENELERLDVLFDLAESFYKEGDDASAQRLYETIVIDGEPENRVVVMSKFRQAQYLDDPNKKLGKWQRRNDLTDSKGDRYYSAVLDHFHEAPQAQEARYGLFKRFVARDDFEQAYEVGRSYLKFDQVNKKRSRAAKAIAGEIILHLVKGLLDNKEYEKVYELYTTEHHHVTSYEGGELLYLVGQALEALYLYDQAAVVYYRALGLPLSDEDKTGLYYRRAEVYITKKDWQSAERLLAYLRKIYKGKKEIGEIYFLSGKLREAQTNKGEALEYYAKAAAVPGNPGEKAKYGEAHVKMLIDLEQYDGAANLLLRYHKENWLAASQLQYWYSTLGDARLRRNSFQAAASSYQNAIGKDMPSEGERVQAIHLHFGEALYRLGKIEDAASHIEAAKTGPNEFYKKRAVEMMQHGNIDRSLAEVRAVLEK